MNAIYEFPPADAVPGCLKKPWTSPTGGEDAPAREPGSVFTEPGTASAGEGHPKGWTPNAEENAPLPQAPQAAEADLASAAGTLTAGESSELTSCEEIIERGLKTFIEVGVALTTIRERKLYRVAYVTFAHYVEERWQMQARQAQRLMVGAEIAKNILAMATGFAATEAPLLMPAGERLVRPLAALPAAQHGAAWLTVIETAPGGRPTAAHVQYVVDVLAGKFARNVEPTVEPPRKRIIEAMPAGTAEEQLREAAAVAIAKVRVLVEMIGAPDSVAGTRVLAALERLDDFNDHLDRMELLQEARR